MSASVGGGLFDGLTLATAHTTSPIKRRIASLLARRQTLALREIMETLNGVAPGSTALKTVTQIANADDLGGARAIETVTLVNRATTAGDVTDINADLLSLSSKTHDPTPIANGDGNPLDTTRDNSRNREQKWLDVGACGAYNRVRWWLTPANGA